ncbi:tRNA dihydrouridine synthase DusB [Psittacicella hinzii]|uniref:tRNA dihydrouridine synthase DusB n=1 Tax=Psittacicella hinzii TaxID=2028575 RepID=A0A3A1Y735_9GAMM|nr:tRNA dihydrouridine synthase DusB [Psittacicella hinzii]RIY33116.1 tRNA dihydrouridine synthase DusB [Psittacicella hinzii]
MSHGFKIDKHQFKNNIVLAPMAGITDAPYRNIHLKHGVGYAVSEMVLANNQFLAQGKSAEHLQIQEIKDNNLGVPRGIQILGHTPEDMASLTKIIVKQNLAEVIDINMGCPAKKVVKKAAGSALMADVPLVKEILKSVIEAAGDVPVTLKMRTGVDKQNKNALDIALMAQDLGIKAITIHGRTREDLFRGQAEYETIARVKEALEIPVIANGDIDSVEKYLYVSDITKADAYMIGRASQGNPWLIAKLASISERSKYIEPDIFEKFSLASDHILDIANYYPEQIGVKIARKHFIWYLENIFPSIYTAKSYNNLESERIQTPISLNSSQINLVEDLLVRPVIGEEHILQDSKLVEHIQQWRSQFIQLVSYRELEDFLSDCLATLK